MFGKPSLVTRIAIGKVLGLAFGLVGFVFLPHFMPDAGWQLRWGILFWYATVGAVIGFAGVYTEHPILHLPLPWWVRAPLIGAWMNFVLVFFAYDQMAAMLTHTFGPGGLLASPWWFVLEGAIIGLVIGWTATRFGGEGPETVSADASVSS